eukprot:7853294-Pyramimonas_sp.AAC.1
MASHDDQAKRRRPDTLDDSKCGIHGDTVDACAARRRRRRRRAKPSRTPTSCRGKQPRGEAES